MTVAPAEPETKRYTQLVQWLWELGVCWRCRHAMAAVQVEREQTGSKEARTQLTCDDAEQCKALAVRGWKSMPAPEAAKP